MKGASSLYYRLYKNEDLDVKIQHALNNLRLSQGRTGYGILSIHDADEIIGELRVIKTDAEIIALKEACRITSDTHSAIMGYTKAGMTEREIHGYFIYQIMKRGAAREGYGTIVASGPNACTLHYVFNDQKLENGHLLLLDAGGEFNYFTSDITRTYPVSGKFTPAQAEVYQGVLDIQKRIIAGVKPGIFFKDMHEQATDELTDLMLRMGLLKGRKEDIIKANEQKKYYPHGVGHFLGMDVHDSGLYFDKKGEPRKIEAGMTFTVEPGLYIPAHDTVAQAAYRGIGVRIEDNILVTTNGHEVMTRNAPKEINDLENLIGRA